MGFLKAVGDGFTDKRLSENFDTPQPLFALVLRKVTESFGEKFTCMLVSRIHALFSLWRNTKLDSSPVIAVLFAIDQPALHQVLHQFGWLRSFETGVHGQL